MNKFISLMVIVFILYVAAMVYYQGVMFALSCCCIAFLMAVPMIIVLFI